MHRTNSLQFMVEFGLFLHDSYDDPVLLTVFEHCNKCSFHPLDGSPK